MNGNNRHCSVRKGPCLGTLEAFAPIGGYDKTLYLPVNQTIVCFTFKGNCGTNLVLQLIARLTTVFDE